MNEFLCTYFLLLLFYGLKFDTVSIIYLNLIFILFSILPLKYVTNPKSQKLFFYIYFIPNIIGVGLNCVDIVYYKFTKSRSNSHIFESIENETNKVKLFTGFLIDYWYVFVYFFGLLILWIYLYKKVKPIHKQYDMNLKYYFSSFIFFILTVLISLVGIRGFLDVSRRPMNVVDASNYVKDLAQTNVILNTSFCILRTIYDTSFEKKKFVSNKVINEEIKPIKQYQSKGLKKMNIVIFIMESFGREYLGSFNKANHIKNFVSYTPFLDSLSTHSIIYTNGYSNGVGSIHAPPSILAGIPSFRDSYTTSPYVNTKIESIVSILNAEGYDTSFYHGAPNGSMGFLGFCNILGFQHYYGMTEYNNDKDFDGCWGIWDEKFVHLVKNKISETNIIDPGNPKKTKRLTRLTKNNLGHKKFKPLISVTNRVLNRLATASTNKKEFVDSLFK